MPPGGVIPGRAAKGREGVGNPSFPDHFRLPFPRLATARLAGRDTPRGFVKSSPYSAASLSSVSPGRTRVKRTGAIEVAIASSDHRATV